MRRLFLATCNANLGEKDIADTCVGFQTYASCCVICSGIILQTESVTGDFPCSLQLETPFG